MRIEDIYVTGGSVIKTDNIIEESGKWNFINNDPQIIIRFDKKVKGLRMETSCVNNSFLSITEVFYGDCGGNSFSAERRITFAKKYVRDNVTDIFFDSEYDFIRIDPDNKNISAEFCKFNIFPLYKITSFIEGMRDNFSVNRRYAHNYLFVSNEFSRMGALNIIKGFTSLGIELKKSNPNDFSETKYDICGCAPTGKFGSLKELKRNLLWEAARDAGIHKAIANCAIGGEVIRELKDYGFTIVCVADSNSCISDALSNALAAKYADYIIFSNESLKDEFNESVKEYYSGEEVYEINNNERDIRFLIETFKKGSRIAPDLDVYKYQNSSYPHYYDRQNEYSYKEKAKALKKAGRFTLGKTGEYTSKIALLDTAVGTDNAGDDIIMSYCDDICDEVFPEKDIIHIPTHIYDERIESIEERIKILCGTNLIYTHMENSRQMVLPYNMKSLKNTCLLGVGMHIIGIDEEPSEFTKDLLKYMLDNRFIHSVRDGVTERFLKSIGIKNVINTSCPSMWALTRERQKKIPAAKSDTVLTTVTDYMADPEADGLMIKILLEEYKNVFLWIQGQVDYSYLKTIADCKKLNLLPPTLKDLDGFLDCNCCDYIGTRLHAGIRSLNKLRRSVVIAVDNRARAMRDDTNLPIIERRDIRTKLREWINNPKKTDIRIDTEKIQKWKKQFKDTASE